MLDYLALAIGANTAILMALYNRTLIPRE